MDTIEYIDWESHPHTVINLCDTVTAILGNSHNGKSGLVRGIELLRSNRPTNTSYFPRGNKKPASSVSISRDDGFVSRVRTKSKNYYDVNGDEYKALRTGVPEQVSEFLNMTDLNIQLQKNVHFMLTETPGERAKILNKTAGLSEMDKATDSVNKRHRAVQSAYDVQSTLLTEKNGELKALDWVDDANEKYKIIEELREELSTLEKRIEDTDNCLGAIESIDEMISELPDVSAIKDIDTIFKVDEELYSLEDKIEAIEKRLKTISETKTALNDIRVPTKKETAILYANSEDLQVNRIAASELNSAIRKIESITDEAVLCNDTVHSHEVEMEAFMAEFDLCPFCAKPMGE